MVQSDTPVDPSITEATVMYKKVAKIGDRVKHFAQRYGNPGTATVGGFYVDPEAPKLGWIKVRVKPDNPSSCYGNTWDWDRTELVSDERR